jgi:hypothetical protein
MRDRARRGRKYPVALACVLLAGCSPPPIEMDYSDAGGRKVVTLYTRTLFGTRSGTPPCVREIIVSNFDSSRQAAPVWSAQVGASVQCARIGAYEIGRAPPGFTQTRHGLPAQLRGRYRVEVRGIGEGRIDIVF